MTDEDFNEKVRRNIGKDDITYPNHFPANINKDRMIVVQITPQPEQSVVLYECKITGNQTRCYLPLSFGTRYIHGITVI